MIALDGGHLSIDDLVQIARGRVAVSLTPDAAEAVRSGERAFAAHAAAGQAIYGWTTGVGALEKETLAPADVPAFQRYLLLSHAAGVGPASSDERVRAMLVTRANTLAKGRSGVRLEVIEALLSLVNRDVRPYVPEIGSVGASDLAPLAHASLVLIGEGWVVGEGGRVPAHEALGKAGLAPIALGGRDAFALINGTSQTLAIGALAVSDAARLCAATEIAAAMTTTGACGRTDFLDARLFENDARPPVVAGVAERLRGLVGNQAGSAGAVLREPLSSRCAPEVLGATEIAVARARTAIEHDLNVCIDNPSLLPDGSLANNSGAMGAQVVAEALDALVTSIVAVAAMSERRTARLLDPARNGGLPAFLIDPGVRAGLCSGLMMAQYTAAALVAELRTRAASASTQSVQVSNGTEDYGSMSALAARRAAEAIALAENVIAIELLVAAQANDLRGAVLSESQRRLRSVVPVLVEDRLLADDIEAVARLLREGAFAQRG